MNMDPVCYVTRSNNAWLINWVGELSIDRPDDELYDCAAALRVARRVAREGAISMGYEGPFRWEPRGPYQHVLHGCGPDA